MSTRLEQRSAPRGTSRRRGDGPGRDLVTVVLGTWVMTGVFIDGWAHLSLDAPETFFTPWHAAFYSGFVAVALWIGRLVVHRRPEGWQVRIPPGYGPAVAGVAVFGAGGVGDLAWHEVFGIEQSLDALLSPTHLLLYTGMMLIAAGPLGATWRRASVTWREVLPAVLAVTLISGGTSFMFLYVRGFNTAALTFPYDPVTGQGGVEVVLAVMAVLTTNFILVGGLVLLLRRWQLPPGAATLLFGSVGVLMAGLEGFAFPRQMVPPVVGGLAADLMIWWLRAGPNRPRAVWVVAGSTPLALWVARMVEVATGPGLLMPAAVWSGMVFFAVLQGLVIAMLAFPPFRAAGADQDGAAGG